MAAALGIIGLVGTLVSGVIGAVGAKQQAQAAADSSNYNAQIADYNKSVAQRNAQVVLTQASQDQQEKQRENVRQLHSIRAAYGASGFALEGSPLDVLEDSAAELSLDVQKVGYKGKLQAIGYTDEATNYGMKAELNRMEAANALKAGKTNAAAAIFGGISKAGTSLMRTG